VGLDHERHERDEKRERGFVCFLSIRVILGSDCCDRCRNRWLGL